MESLLTYAMRLCEVFHTESLLKSNKLIGDRAVWYNMRSHFSSTGMILHNVDKLSASHLVTTANIILKGK